MSRDIVEVIRNITEETGYPPTPEELADVLEIPVKSVHSSLLYEKRHGIVGYDEHERLVVRDMANTRTLGDIMDAPDCGCGHPHTGPGTIGVCSLFTCWCKVWHEPRADNPPESE